MPTKNPRLMITLTEEQRAVLDELGELQGRSAASFVRELVDAATPLLQSLATVMRAHVSLIQSQPTTVKKLVAEVIQKTYGDPVEPSQIDLEDHLALLVPLTPDAEAARDRSLRGPRRSAPPSSNTGVSPAQQGGSDQSQGRPRKSDK